MTETKSASNRNIILAKPKNNPKQKKTITGKIMTKKKAIKAKIIKNKNPNLFLQKPHVETIEPKK